MFTGPLMARGDPSLKRHKRARQPVLRNAGSRCPERLFSLGAWTVDP